MWGLQTILKRQAQSNVSVASSASQAGHTSIASALPITFSTMSVWSCAKGLAPHFLEEMEVGGLLVRTHFV